MSPVPPGETAKALFVLSEIILTTAFHSSRVILPSLFESRLSKKSLIKVFWASALLVRARADTSEPCRC
jgi:hypothetical protein